MTIDESTELYAQMKELMGDESLSDLPEPVRAAVRVHHTTVKRNKRCALAYVDHRMTTMKRLRWELGPLLPEDIRTNLSHQENTFLADYDKLVTEYKVTSGVDLTADLTPPKDLLVQVRVLRDCGEVMIEGGSVSLEKGTKHSLPRRDIEHLVRQGYLEEHQEGESC